MFNGFFKMINSFAHLEALASHLRKIQRRFRMFHKLVSMPLFTMGHRLLRVIDGLADVTRGGRMGIHHGHTHERSKRNHNEGSTAVSTDHLFFPPWLEFTAEKDCKKSHLIQRFHSLSRMFCPTT